MHILSTRNLWKFSIVKITALTLVLGFILRILLLFNPETKVDFSFVDWIQIFILGTFNDLFFAIVGCTFLCLFLLTWTEHKYRKPFSIIFLAVLAATFVITRFVNTPLHEFNSGLNRIIGYLALWKFISYALRLRFPQWRVKWRQYTYYVVIYLYVTSLIFNVISEYVFWNEFGVRYNFIAVDYLVYTNEVIGNLFESYPMIPILTGVALVSLAVTIALIRRMDKSFFIQLPDIRHTGKYAALYLSAAVFSLGMIIVNMVTQHGANNYVNELQANGCVKFCQAFVNNSLDYKDFYTMLPRSEAFRLLHSEYGSTGGNEQVIHSDTAEVHKNIVLITIESMSAEYLKRFGNREGITPNLDRLMSEGLSFDNLYAAGNRTVRGLEAVTLCVPPSPGESIIKQSRNSHLSSIATVLKSKGYTMQFFYGGDSYFDNMKEFFSGNGYQIVDQNDYGEGEITFKTVWGMCDENLFGKVIRELGKDAATGKPFFAHVMTVSNHRPYTYPDNRIDIPASSKSREGGVKYTDYAIGEFFKSAKKQPWFRNTVFIITADHCASSAGSTNVPLNQYHIPAVVYAPGFIKPMKNSTLMSQIDIMPTLFGLLHFDYTSRFYGRDVLSPGYHPRAYAATYEDLGYFDQSVLTVLSPVRRQLQFHVNATRYTLTTGGAFKSISNTHLKRAVANYQTVNEVLKR